mmetsp:Transcript_108432/g.329631  ORF Transcript_108432/g.329631 Transcript_108432/m.329631 type:complete len:454 (-) Transcript_108432:116-1477(-)
MAGASAEKPHKAVFRRGREELASLLAEIPSGPREVATLLGRLAYYQPTEGDVGKEFLPCVATALEAAGIGDDVAGLFGAISRWALGALESAGPGAFPAVADVWLPGGGEQSVVYSAAQCRGLLANALLLNVHDTCHDAKDMGSKGGLEFEKMMMSTRPMAAHKLACLLQYFEASRGLEGTEADARQVVFERRVAAPGCRSLADFKTWVLEEGAHHTCDGSAVSLHDAGMEAVEAADAFVNFANRNFGFGCFIPSCTQEEILQVCCPEFNVGMLHQGMMLDFEVVVVHGVRRFSRYTGYGDGFQYAGAWSGSPSVQSILTIDATTKKHYAEESVLRDVRKAYLGFRGCSMVSTGRWGCGAFGGSPPHKFAQQLVAASLAGCTLHFSTFGSPDECDVVLEAVAAARPSAAALLMATLAASSERRGFTSRLVALLQAPQPGPPSPIGAGGAALQEV